MQQWILGLHRGGPDPLAGRLGLRQTVLHGEAGLVDTQALERRLTGCPDRVEILEMGQTVGQFLEFDVGQIACLAVVPVAAEAPAEVGQTNRAEDADTDENHDPQASKDGQQQFALHHHAEQGAGTEDDAGGIDDEDDAALAEREMAAR